MNEAKTRAKIHELHACAVGWAAKSHRAADDGHMMDAQQHMRRAHDARYEAYKLEQTLAEGAMK